MRSVIPTHRPYGSFTGGLYRIYKICNNVTIFLDRCGIVGHSFEKRLFPTTFMEIVPEVSLFTKPFAMA